MTAPLRVAHGNGKNRLSLVDFVRDARADSASAMESQLLERRWRELERDHHLRQTVAGRGWAEEHDRARSTRILTRTSRANIGELTRLASEKVQAYEKYAPDRVLVVSMYEHPIARRCEADGVAHLALHPDAGGMISDPDQDEHRVVREYREAWATFRRTARMLRDDGLLIIGTTDAQMTVDRKVEWNPAVTTAYPLKLAVRAIGFDWLMYDERLRLQDFRTVELFDHSGFVAELRPR